MKNGYEVDHAETQLVDRVKESHPFFHGTFRREQKREDLKGVTQRNERRQDPRQTVAQTDVGGHFRKVGAGDEQRNEVFESRFQNVRQSAEGIFVFGKKFFHRAHFTISLGKVQIKWGNFKNGREITLQTRLLMI